MTVTPTGKSHQYLSTACLHAIETTLSTERKAQLHAHCSSQLGTQGEKRPNTCKWCDATCVCYCHKKDDDDSTK